MQENIERKELLEASASQSRLEAALKQAEADAEHERSEKERVSSELRVKQEELAMKEKESTRTQLQVPTPTDRRFARNVTPVRSVRRWQVEELERQKAALTKQMLDAAQSTINAGSMEERHDSVLSMVKKVCVCCAARANTCGSKWRPCSWMDCRCCGKSRRKRHSKWRRKTLLIKYEALPALTHGSGPVRCPTFEPTAVAPKSPATGWAGRTSCTQGGLLPPTGRLLCALS